MKRVYIGSKHAIMRAGIIIVVGLLLALSGIFAFRHFRTTPLVTPTSSITQQVSFPIYLPRQLPSGFKVDSTSFRYISAEGIFLFQATDKAGDTIIFSEQPKPKNMDFATFRNKQLLEPRDLQDVPYPSTTGKTLDKKTTLLSIVTEDTWVMVATQSQMSNQQIREIAVGITRYKHSH